MIGGDLTRFHPHAQTAGSIFRQGWKLFQSGGYKKPLGEIVNSVQVKKRKKAVTPKKKQPAKRVRRDIFG